MLATISAILLVLVAIVFLPSHIYPYLWFLSARQPNTYPSYYSRFALRGSGLNIIPPYSPHPGPETLPLLAWVIVATPSSIQEHGDLLTQISCYCLLKGIPFHLDHQIIVDDRHLVTGRHANVAKYLKRYQWVFATDADILIADSTKDLRDYIQEGEVGDGVDVIFNDRRNREVCACAYFLKNSPGGWSFLRRWVAWADGWRHSTNWDNGDLGEMIAAGLIPGPPNNAEYTGRITTLEEEEVLEHPPREKIGCISKSGEAWGWEEYGSIFVACFEDFVKRYRTADDRIPFWEVNLWSWASVLPPTKMRVYKVLSGFNRWGLGEGTSIRTWDGVRLPGDFLISGKGLEQFVNADGALCSGKDWVIEPR
ncbi:hypothetical protein IAR55_007174 [Kwoniella newhampshirensis]|uniref:Alpha-1,6-mannosyltransferase n=1 Tax=Kwoniella newhampshirensis TaxID=1651941 RepID=A0AAW0YDS2_9TREE